MILDSIGVGLLGSSSHVFELALQHCQVHSMDFDDTWHPATHPSGAVLPALLAIAQMLPGNTKPSGMDLLLAFNVGIEIQGRFMMFSNEAQNIPNRFHPPTVVGPLGSAAACSRLLSLDRLRAQTLWRLLLHWQGLPWPMLPLNPSLFIFGTQPDLID
ncbi:UNVERIFIED_CONTAM: hypothetical protein FKN15_056719 [Acipenser sinensis]